MLTNYAHIDWLIGEGLCQRFIHGNTKDCDIMLPYSNIVLVLMVTVMVPISLYW